MAYRNNIIKKYYTSVATFMSVLWTEIEAMGWTLVDNRDDSNFRVYSSTNPNGLKGYVKISWTTTQIKCLSYTSWSGQGGSGAGQQYDGYNSLTFSESGTYCWIYGNDQFLYLMSLIGSNYYQLFCGHLIPDTNIIAQLTQSVTSGSNVSITVNSTTGFIAGKKYQIVDYSTGMRQWVQVSSITDSTHMVISSLANNYNATTSYIGTTPIIFGAMSGTTAFYYTTPLYITGNGTPTNTQDYFILVFQLISKNYVNPNNRAHQFRWLQPLILGSENGVNYYALVGYRDDYIFQPPSGAEEDVYLYTLNKDYNDAGTSSGSNNVNTLNDTSKSWTENQWQNKVVYISGGIGAGQIRKISSNTSTQLTVSVNWTTTPDATSVYQIVDEAYRVGKGGIFALREGY